MAAALVIQVVSVSLKIERKMGIIFGDQVADGQPKVIEEKVDAPVESAENVAASEEVAEPVDDVVSQPVEKPVRRGRRRK